MYALYQLQRDLLYLPRTAAVGLSGLTMALDAATGIDVFRPLRAGCELFARMNFHHTQPCFGIDAVAVDGREVSVTEEATLSTAFGTLLHFRKHCEDNPARTMPKVLVVAPLSGHFATCCGTPYGCCCPTTTCTSPTGTTRETSVARPGDRGSRSMWII